MKHEKGFVKDNSIIIDFLLQLLGGRYCVTFGRRMVHKLKVRFVHSMEFGKCVMNSRPQFSLEGICSVWKISSMCLVASTSHRTVVLESRQ